MRTESVLLAWTCVLAGCSHELPPKPIPAVRVEVVRSGTGAGGNVAYSAVAQPETTVPLAFGGPGYVVEVRQVQTSDGRSRALGEGDRVRRGDVVARLRDTEYRDKLEQASGKVAAARAAAEKARLDFDRATRLSATQSITRPEMEAATAQRHATQAQLAAAEAAREEARVALRDTALVAPVDAEILKKNVEPGAFMGPGVPAFVLGDVSSVKVVLGLPDVALQAVRLGQPVTVSTDALPGRTFAARVSRIASAADPATRNFDVEVGIPNRERLWRPGMIASVEVGSAIPQAATPLLPLIAFVQAPGGQDRFGVMVVEGSGPDVRAKLRPVELGDVVGNRVAVARGLAPGERVVTTGASMVTDGERVEVMPSEEP
ncbi:MAG TPA: efflux RND transporter periplasmic adaptor subunit [Anaeromyxobacteraceae bacterium]|nr:efflux RND transporter periplasmic adaptor subunit [Anaeromyxobacteraceae bacterium]